MIFQLFHVSSFVQNKSEAEEEVSDRILIDVTLMAFEIMSVLTFCVEHQRNIEIFKGS